MIDHALSGIRVVALEQAVALPFCTSMLAALGADVIKVEPPQGDVVRGWDDVARGLSTGFVAFNAGKRDVTIDAKTPGGRKALHRLALTADVFAENFAPGAADRLGVGPDAVRAQNPSVVYCSLSGYGRDGPYRDTKAYDLLVQGEAGLLLTNGTVDAPAKVGIPVTDQIAGVHAALGVVAALSRRAATGEGATLDIAMLESAVYWLAYYPHYSWHAGTEPPRSGMRHQYLCPYGPFLASDQRYVNLVVASDNDWSRFCGAVDQPHWVDDRRFATVADRRRSRHELDALVEAVIATAPSDRWFERLAAAGLAHGQVRTIESVLNHPQLAARRMFSHADSPVGQLPMMRFPLVRAQPSRVPALGEHTDEVLAELGYEEDEIVQLHQQGAV